MLVIAVEDFDVDAGFGHAPGEETELTGDGLLESHDDHLPLGEDAHAGCFQRLAGGRSVLEEEMGHPGAADDPGPSPFDAHPGAPQRLAHLGERAGSILEDDGEILHRVCIREPLMETTCVAYNADRLRRTGAAGLRP